MTLQVPLKKTAAIRRAREAVPAPISLHPPQFIVRMPSDVQHLDSETVEVVAQNYLDAQHIRSNAISRIALALMGVDPVVLAPGSTGTIERILDQALDRAAHEGDQGMQFWQVQFPRK